ncbi:MAG: methyltransferase domain-containing protein [Hyphomicrobiales bacterium]
MLSRVIEPEWLDHLPADHRGALRSRRDLRILNAVMLHDRIVAAELRKSVAGGAAEIADIGGGDGEFLLKIARRLDHRWQGSRVTVVDRHDIVTPATQERFDRLGWRVAQVTMDVFAWLEGQPTFDAIVANLFLHHFADAELERLFRAACGVAPLFIACEPRRTPGPLLASKLVWGLGCNRVTRHDAPASVRAGFAGRELSALWPDDPDWTLRERRAGPFSHLFVARHA